MIATRYKAICDRALGPVASLMIRCGVSPTVITLGGVCLTAASCLYLLLTRRLVTFSVLVTVAGMLDALDGAVARRSGRVTAFGSYLDAVCDRYVEAGVLLCVAVVTGYWILSMTMLIGAMLVSYSKARAAMEIPISNMEWPDVMERMERDVPYIIGLALSQVIPVRLFGHDLFWWTLLILGALIHATVLQRILRARRLIHLRAR